MTTSESSDRSAAFTAAVSERKLKADSAASDKVARGLGVALMVVGLVGTFLAYNNSRNMDDGRDIASNQIFALVFLPVITGAAEHRAEHAGLVTSVDPDEHVL